MIKLALRILLGLVMGGTLVYLALHSNLLDHLEGTNPDGSNSLTWRSGVTLVFTIVLCETAAFWSSRRGFALTIFLGSTTCFASSYWLFNSKYGFIWEKHGVDGTYQLTWRSDLTVIAMLLICILISYLVLRKTRQFRLLRRLAS